MILLAKAHVLTMGYNYQSLGFVCVSVIGVLVDYLADVVDRL